MTNAASMATAYVINYASEEFWDTQASLDLVAVAHKHTIFPGEFHPDLPPPLDWYDHLDQPRK